MEKTASTIPTNTVGLSRTRRVRKAPTDEQREVQKTPESELMSVEEYFDMVWDRYLEKYEKLQD